jgi:LmbE family N-acetylglucosaminyl deacetylase
MRNGHGENNPRLLPAVAPSSAFRLPPSALVVVAHPDDVESLCGGTIALLREAGVKVAYLLLTSGDKGSPDPQIDPRALAATREAEQLAAAQLLGIDDVVFLRRLDGEVADDLPTRAAVAAQIRRVRPDLLITFDPWHHYTFHNDHRQCGLVALAAARTLACQSGPTAGLDGATLLPHAPPHRIPDAWLFNTDSPNLVFDIAPVIERKVAARVAHACQTADPAATARGVHQRAATVGAPYNLAFAEAFHAVRLPVEESPLARLDVGEW